MDCILAGNCQVAELLLKIKGLELRVKDQREELDGLMTELLVSHETPRGGQSVTGWLREHGPELGQAYASELARHARASPEE